MTIRSFYIVSGWKFGDESTPPCTPDPLNSAKLLRDVYLLTDADYVGRITVPVCMLNLFLSL